MSIYGLRDEHEFSDLRRAHLDEWNKRCGARAKQKVVPKVIACATMWHERRCEMKGLVESIYKMDWIQRNRRFNSHAMRDKEKAVYDFEAHIFFDDAWEDDDTFRLKGHAGFRTVNGFVEDLSSIIMECADSMFPRVVIHAPKKVPTPYGARYLFTLPGGTPLTVHLKDKKLIRHKKRWSQVMYMYYLLGYKLINAEMDDQVKSALADNTYLLTLDGDIRFEPEAVDLLFKSIDADNGIGATCGRIHPHGYGILAAYQTFEYSVGHWLQKETEHVLGSVVCAPGCFSMFRGRALLHDGVMRRYATKSEEPQHYVQYDQGEDRWLCTLILKAGFRVEYNCLSDSYTRCPETFDEFFNQRRRWVPSTIANILDLIQDFRGICDDNDSVRPPYMMYQMLLLLGTVIGPGTIFLMLVSGMVAGLHVSNVKALAYNLVPIITFCVACKLLPSKQQLKFAFWLSCYYVVLNVAVMGGVAIQLAGDGLETPTGLFFVTSVTTLLMTAVLHPFEFHTLLYFPLYVMLIPTMYLVLIIYSIFNMNVVSWGTREMPAKVEKAAPKKEKNKLNKKTDDNSTNTTKKIERTTQINEADAEEHVVTLINPKWGRNRSRLYRILDGYLEDDEAAFWRSLVRQFLYPIDSNKLRQATDARRLSGLRDNWVLAFVGANVLWVMTLFWMSVNRDRVYLPWPRILSATYTILSGRNVLVLQEEYVTVQPLGVVLALFFGAIIVIQFVCMLFHRINTIVLVLNCERILTGVDRPDVERQRTMEDSLEVVRGTIDFFRALEEREEPQDWTPAEIQRTREAQSKVLRMCWKAFKKMYETEKTEEEKEAEEAQKQAAAAEEEEPTVVAAEHDETFAEGAARVTWQVLHNLRVWTTNAIALNNYAVPAPAARNH